MSPQLVEGYFGNKKMAVRNREIEDATYNQVRPIIGEFVKYTHHITFQVYSMHYCHEKELQGRQDNVIIIRTFMY